MYVSNFVAILGTANDGYGVRILCNDAVATLSGVSLEVCEHARRGVANDESAEPACHPVSFLNRGGACVDPFRESACLVGSPRSEEAAVEESRWCGHEAEL